MDESVRGDRSPHLQLAAILESQEVAIISKSLDGVILSWNPGRANLRIHRTRGDRPIGGDAHTPREPQ